MCGVIIGAGTFSEPLRYLFGGFIVLLAVGAVQAWRSGCKIVELSNGQGDRPLLVLTMPGKRVELDLRSARIERTMIPLHLKLAAENRKTVVRLPYQGREYVDCEARLAQLAPHLCEIQLPLFLERSWQREVCMTVLLAICMLALGFSIDVAGMYWWIITSLVMVGSASVVGVFFLFRGVEFTTNRISLLYGLRKREAVPVKQLLGLRMARISRLRQLQILIRGHDPVSLPADLPLPRGLSPGLFGRGIARLYNVPFKDRNESE